MKDGTATQNIISKLYNMLVSPNFKCRVSRKTRNIICNPHQQIEKPASGSSHEGQGGEHSRCTRAGAHGR